MSGKAYLSYFFVICLIGLLVMMWSGPEMLKETREYLGTVRAMCLNADYAAVSFEGKVQLHMVNILHLFTLCAN